MSNEILKIKEWKNGKKQFEIINNNNSFKRSVLRFCDNVIFFEGDLVKFKGLKRRHLIFIEKFEDDGIHVILALGDEREPFEIDTIEQSEIKTIFGQEIKPILGPTGKLL